MSKSSSFPSSIHVRSDAKFVDVANALRKEIQEGRWAPGERLPTWTDLCRRFDLGRPTLTRTLDTLKEERYIVSNSTRGTYVAEFPPHLHRYPLLLQGRPGKIGREGWNLFWNALQRDANKGVFPDGDYIEPYLDANLHLDNVPYQKVIRYAQTQSIAGIFIAYGTELEKFPTLPNTPSVFLGCAVPVPFPLAILYDWNAFCTMAIQEFLAQGRRNIAILSACVALSDDIAIQIARDAGAYCPDEWTFATSPDISLDTIRNLIHLLLSKDRSKRPDALLVSDDNLVPGVLKGLDAAGIRTPEDVLVIVHCNDAAKAVTRPGVQSLCFPVHTALTEAIRIAKAARKDPSYREQYLLAPEFL